MSSGNMERVLRLMAGEPAELIPVIQPELVVRDSCAAPRERRVRSAS